MPAKRPSHPQRERGAYAVAFVLTVVLLMGFIGLALDAGRLFVAKTELQNAADACALSAAAALTGANDDQLDQAEAWGKLAGGRNLVGMQDKAVPANDITVSFSTSLDGQYLPRMSVDAGNVLSMRYVRCTMRERDIETVLIQVINLLPGNAIGLQEAAATAVASNRPSVSNCALPLAICATPPDHADDDAYGYRRGEWIKGRYDAGEGTKGSYQWVSFPSANETKVPDLAALIQGSGQCDLHTAQEVKTKPGAIASLAKAWNSRFGVYVGQFEGTSDLTGYSYTPNVPAGAGSPKGETGTWPSEFNAFDDFKAKRASNERWNDTLKQGGWRDDGVDFTQGSDRRVVVGPIVDCEELYTKASTQIVDWACYLMLHPISDPAAPGDDVSHAIEYRGVASDPSSGCVTSGLSGGPAAGGPKVPTLVQ